MEDQKKISFTQEELDYIMTILARYTFIPDIKRVMLILMFIMRDTSTVGE